MASGLGNLRSILLSYRDRSVRAYHAGAGRRKGRAIGLLLLLAMGRPAAATVSACDAAGGEAVTVTGVGEDWSLALADGRSLKLAGIDPLAPTPDHPDLSDGARGKLAAWLVGHAAVAVPLAAGIDRWGRTTALVFAPGDSDKAASERGAPLSIALALVDAGLARGRPEAGFSACWPGLIEAERRARTGGLGLWSDPYYAVLDGGNPTLGVDRTGTMVIVEGRVGRVGEGRARVFIGLGQGRDAVSVSLARRDLFILSQAGLDESRLVGRRLRVRGTLDDRGGPSIDVTDAGQIEVVEGPAMTPVAEPQVFR